MRRKRIVLAAKVIASATMLLLVYRHVSVEDVSVDFHRLHLLPLLAFILIMFTNTFLSVLKWRLLLAADGIRSSMSQLVSSYMIGVFFNLFLPSTIGGDAYRIASLRSAGIPKLSASVLADRLSGFITLTIICASVSAIARDSIGHRAFFLLPMLLLLAQMGLTLALLLPDFGRWLLRRSGMARFTGVMTFMESLFVSFRSYREQPWLLLRVMIISFAFQLLMTTAIFCLSEALDLGIPFMLFMVFVPVVNIMEAVPISIFGLGLRDAGYVFFFTQAGLVHAESHALAISMLYVLLTVAYAALGGGLFMRRLFLRKEERPSAKPECELAAGINQTGM